jgi:hypothetical protein
MNFLKQRFAIFVSSCPVLAIARDAFVDQAHQSVVVPAETTQRTSEQLQQLMVLIALYPRACFANGLPARQHQGLVHRPEGRRP